MSKMKEKPYFAYRSFWPELETMKNMYDAGVGTICFFPANTLNSLGEPYCKYPPNWLWYDQYDFSVLDKQIEDIVSVCPDVKLICMVDLNSPEWLMKNQICYDSFSELGRVVCNEEWKKIMADYLEAFLKYAEAKYSDRISAYCLSGGKTSEWMDFSRGVESPEKTAGFKRWCSEQGFPEPSDIPPPSQRENLSHDGLFRDPVDDKLSLDYWRFCSVAVADAIEYFVGKAREIIPAEKDVGVFYGYAIELNGDRLLSLSHLEYERLLDLPGLDFLISPGTYRDREIGGGSGFMTPAGTVRCKGKSFMHECDQRTHTYNANLTPFVSLDFQHFPDEVSTIAGLRREMALALINGMSLWWFDMWGGFYQGEKVFENFSLMKGIWDRFAGCGYESSAEVAMIIDADGCYYLNQTDSDLNNFQNRMQDDSFLHGVRDKLNRLGAPYDIFSMNDIPTIENLSQYKCVIFCTPFEIDARKKEMLQKYVLGEGRTVTWLTAPGISDGKQWQPERVKEFAGVDYRTPGISRVDMDGWSSVYVSSTEILSVAELKKIALESGVHFYSDLDIPIYGNSKLLAVHHGEGGELKIELPRNYSKVTELFSGEVAAENSSSFVFDFPTPGTCLFELD